MNYGALAMWHLAFKGLGQFDEHLLNLDQPINDFDAGSKDQCL